MIYIVCNCFFSFTFLVCMKLHTEILFQYGKRIFYLGTYRRKLFNMKAIGWLHTKGGFFFRKCDVFYRSPNLQKNIPKNYPELEI